MVPESAFEVVGVAVDLDDDVVVVSSPVADHVADTSIDELSRQLESTRVEVISLTA